MKLFFLIAKAVVFAFKAVRAAAGILLVLHGTYKWATLNGLVR